MELRHMTVSQRQISNVSFTLVLVHTFLAYLTITDYLFAWSWAMWMQIVKTPMGELQAGWQMRKAQARLSSVKYQIHN